MPEKAIYWHGPKTLLAADLHLGKIHHFRKSGIGLPIYAQFENFDRLSYLLLNYDVKRVIILGDLFHSHYNESWEAFKSFLGHFHNIHFVLLKGNHDILGKEFYRAVNLDILEESLIENRFVFSHYPQKSVPYYNFCGHIHPAVKLKGLGRQTLKLPCFYFSGTHAILPSFGTFTGSSVMDIKVEDQVYAITDSKVIKVL